MDIVVHAGPSRPDGWKDVSVTNPAAPTYVRGAAQQAGYAFDGVSEAARRALAKREHQSMVEHLSCLMAYSNSLLLREAIMRATKHKHSAEPMWRGLVQMTTRAGLG
jgi:hypothetical protein